MKKITVLLLTLLLTINLSACKPSRGADIEDIEDIVFEMGYDEVLFVTFSNVYFIVNYTDDYSYEDIQPMDSSAVYVAFALKDDIEYMIIYPNNLDFPIIEIEQDVLPYEVLLYVQENLEDILTESGNELLRLEEQIVTHTINGNIYLDLDIGVSPEQLYLRFDFGLSSIGDVSLLENDNGEFVLFGSWNGENIVLKVFTIDDIK